MWTLLKTEGDYAHIRSNTTGLGALVKKFDLYHFGLSNTQTEKPLEDIEETIEETLGEDDE